MDGWKTCLLGDILTFQRGYDLPKTKMVDGKYPVVGSNGIIGYHHTYTTEAPSVTIGRSGNTGNPFIVYGRSWSHNTTLYVKEFKGSDPVFAYYLLKTLDLGYFAGGSAVPTLNRNHIHTLEVAVPPLSEQIGIGQTLKALDDKITANTAINHHLEQMAQAIFKSWFVDFEPFGGVMPDDWREGILGDILQSIKQPVKAGERTELPYVPIDTIPMNSLALTDFRPNQEAQSSLLMFEKNDILIGAMRVYFHRVSIAPFDGITRTTCFILRPRERVYLEYALLLCNEDSTIDYAQNTSKGSTMPYAVWDNGLANLPIAIPTSEVAQEFSNTLCPIIERLRESLFEIRHLSSLRDSLLPRLMSGELSVADLSR